MNHAKYILLLLTLAGGTAWAQPAEEPASQPAEVRPALPWKLPPAAVAFDHLSVSCNMMNVFLEYAVSYAGQSDRCYVLFNGRNEKPVDLKQMLKQAGKTDVTGICGVSFSPNFQYMAIEAETRGHNVAYLVETSTQKVQKLLEDDSITMIWGGNRLFLSTSDRRTVGKIRVVDPVAGKVTELPLCGSLLGATLDGQYAFCICDPRTPGRTIGVAEFPLLDVCRINLAGKVTDKLFPGKEATGGFRLSADGRCIARMEARPKAAPGAPEQEATIRVSVREEAKESNDWSFKGKGTLVGVTNKGSVILLGEDQAGKGGPLVILDAQGRSRTLAKAALAAAMSFSHMVLYVAPGDSPTLQMNILPLAEAEQ